MHIALPLPLVLKGVDKIGHIALVSEIGLVYAITRHMK
jgi:hypothetical protein